MKDTSIQQKTITDSCSSFIEELGDKIEWQWDNHFDSYLAEFSVDHQEYAFKIAEKHFPYVWNKKSIRKANPILRHRAGFFNLIEKNQRLLSKDTNGEHDVMLVWWPWGHGATISMRLFCTNTLNYSEPKGWFAKIKAFFGR